MPCGCAGGQSRSYRDIGTVPASRPAPVAAAAQAGASEQYEVVKSNGASTGRKFTSLVAAARYATAIGGKTRPLR